MMNKAKAYDEALEKAKGLLDSPRTCFDINQLKDIFPQLKESDDERVRKSLIEFLTVVKEISESGRTTWTVRKGDAEMCESFIAYLEKQKECVIDNTSEDEKMLQTIIQGFKNWKVNGMGSFNGTKIDDILAYLEKQKYDRMQPVYDNQESFESALDKAWKAYNDCGSRTVDSCEDDYIESAYAKGFREGYLFGLEKQKEPENTSASTMAPSCWEVEQKPKAKAKSPLSPHELYDAKIEGISQGRQDVLDHPEQFGLQKPAEWSEDFEENIRTLLHDKLSWYSEDGNMSSTVFIDDKTLKDIINGIWFYVGKEALKYPSKELNVTEWSEEDKRMFSRCIKSIECSKQFADSETYKAAKDVEIAWLKDISLNHKKFTEAVYKLWSNDWSDEDKEALDMCLDAIPKRWKTKSGILLTKWLKDNIHLQPKQDWNEEDEEIWFALITFFKTYLQKYPPLCKDEKTQANRILEWLNTTIKSFRLHHRYKPTKEQMEALKNSAYGTYQNGDGPALRRLYEQLLKLGVEEEPEYYQHFDPDC